MRGYSFRIPHSEFRIWNILDIFRQTKQNIFIPLVKAKVLSDEVRNDGKKAKGLAQRQNDSLAGSDGSSHVPQPHPGIGSI
jgi:hypothetical protein